MSVHGGILEFDGKTPDEDLLTKLRAACARYAPDEAITYMQPAAAVFYRPFHTTKESRMERQPFVSPHGHVLVWDGRLDNRDELLSLFSEDVSTEGTDVGIFAAAYDRWNAGCFRKVLGDWAVAVWDPRTRTLDLAVDYMGIRHVYYALQNGHLLWCTHLEPIVVSLGTSLTLNEEYIAGYLASFPDPQHTPFSEIKAVSPGTFVRFQNGSDSVRTYWNFESVQPTRYRTDTEYEAHFLHVFRAAVDRCLRSDSPVLAELSGGLDSSSIVCMADDIITSGQCESRGLHTVSYFSHRDPEGDDPIFLNLMEERRGKPGYHIHLDELGAYFSLENCPLAASPQWIGDRKSTRLNSSHT